MDLVNGYVCRDCTDVAFAKKGVDPADPTKATPKIREEPTEMKAPDQARAVDPTRLLDILA